MSNLWLIHGILSWLIHGIRVKDTLLGYFHSLPLGRVREGLPLPILFRRHTIVPLENLREVVLVIEAYTVGDLRDVDGTQVEKVDSLLHAHVADELTGGYTRHLLHLAMELGTAQTNIVCQCLYIIFGIGEVLMDAVDDALHQYLVVAFHLFLADHLIYLRFRRRLTLDTS